MGLPLPWTPYFRSSPLLSSPPQALGTLTLSIMGGGGGSVNKLWLIESFAGIGLFPESRR